MNLPPIFVRSQDVQPGSIFFALKGSKVDGAHFIPEALSRGASKVYAESSYPDPRVEVIPHGIKKRLGEMASDYFGNPTHSLKMIGVTGTSGKTTTTYLIQHLLKEAGIRCARLGTNGGEFEQKNWETQNTTPDAITLQRWFREVLDQGATHVVMEVSSHALDQDRVWGITWDSCVFLNLSHDHLDYHPNLESYFLAKTKLFTDHVTYSRAHQKNPRLWSTHDNPYAKRLLDQPGVDDFFILEEPYSEVCPLLGTFQKQNILAAVAVAKSMGVTESKILSALRSFNGVPGRMESVPNDQGVQVIVDYAHKPEALKKVLESIQAKRVLTVFGCGGDRDRSKRPVMGEIATRLSHRTWITSDNPRTEDPDQILADIVAGVHDRTRCEVIPDRRSAIRAAIQFAETGDCVLIAGKGHENYQLVGTQKTHFDDREEAQKALLIRSRVSSDPNRVT